MYSPVKKTAAKPLFWTELSDKNSSLNELPSEVMTGGSLDPQKTPCFRISPEPSFEDRARLSYSQSCWKKKETKFFNKLNNEAHKIFSGF